MIRDKQIAERLRAVMFDVSGMLDASVGLVKKNCTANELRLYRRAVGNVMGEIADNVLTPLFAIHPSIAPPGLRSPHEEPVPSPREAPARSTRGRRKT